MSNKRKISAPSYFYFSAKEETKCSVYKWYNVIKTIGFLSYSMKKDITWKTGKSLKIGGIGAIRKIVAYFEVSPSGKFPYNKIQIKIMETQSGSFIGIPNVAPKERQTFSPDWRAGFGRSVEDALENTIKAFLESVAEHEAFEDNDFEWADPLDF